MADSKPASDQESGSNGHEMIMKGFEAMWYQAEVQHKRTQDKLDMLEKVLKTQTEQMEKLENVLKDRIMMFSQDIIATMKDMRAVEQDRMNLLMTLLLPSAPVAPSNKSQEKDSIDDVPVELHNPVDAVEEHDAVLA